MHIGLVVNSSWNALNFRKSLIAHFIRDGHSVTIVAPDDGYSQELINLGCCFQPLRISNKGTNPLEDIWLLRQLFSIYKKFRFDVVLHYTIKPNIYGSLAAKLINVPCINNVTGLGTVFIHNNLSSRVAHWLYKLAFKFPKVVFFQNPDDKELFESRKLVSASITDLVPGSGIDTELFKLSSNALGCQSSCFTFLMVARLLFDKGIVEYVDAIRLLRKRGIKAKFQVLGKVELQKGLGVTPDMVLEWQNEGLIEYLGAVSDVRPIVEAAHCVVLPSYREGTPRSLLEAASLSKPLVATNVPGCTETVLDGYNGFLCEVRNAEDLADKMWKMYTLTPEKLKEMGHNSRKLVEEKFDMRIVITKYENAIYDKILL
ncbi:MAG: glycosyltransferase family 1 protein [Cytophagales bacterium]|nr:MAG: glycosyltransferase family 1 protein [Cytophagales bacterium]TAF60767.1 MAG: glycosyltransferase family 1 protein [Cytophagales bacterium]